MPETRLKRTRELYPELHRNFSRAVSTTPEGQAARKFADDWIALELAYIETVQADNHANASD